MKVTAMILALFTLILSVKSYAQIKCEEALVITKPCQGILLPEEDATEGLRCLEVDIPSIKLEHEKELALLNLDLKILNTELTLEKDQSNKFENLLKLTLSTEPEVIETSFLESPVLWGIIGVAVGAGVSIGVFYAVK